MTTSWLSIPKESHFSLANVPFGIISTAANTTPRPAVAVGDYALDLSVFSSQGGFAGLNPALDASVFSRPTLNAFAALGRPAHRQAREHLQEVFSESTKLPQVLKDNVDLRKTALLPLKTVQMHLPMDIGDYTDFYAGLHHAFNVGTLFRGPDNALQPNYYYLPVGYHGRASSVVVSGTPIRRPCGQILSNPTAEPKVPTFAPSKRLDIELELGAFVSRSNAMGEPIPVDQASDYIFGVVLMNDWSARDVQAWEYVPLGPFNAKNFGTTISPWVVLTDALEPFLEKGIPNKHELISYLKETREKNMYDIKLEVDLKSKTPNHSHALPRIPRLTNVLQLKLAPLQPSAKRHPQICSGHLRRCSRTTQLAAVQCELVTCLVPARLAAPRMARKEACWSKTRAERVPSHCRVMKSGRFSRTVTPLQSVGVVPGRKVRLSVSGNVWARFCPH
jgi:fumarylacetoacetase